jgi:hypothetical protein
MNRGILKALFGGAILGTALFFAPFFVLKMMLVFFIIAGLFRIMFWRRIYYWGRPHMYMAMADKVRNMSEAEYTEFKSKMNHWEQHGYQGSCRPQNRKEETINPKD